ncbi:urease accessory protein UreE [Ornithobacterium rhinotracheale]|uniref:urease accessory protein UreE n=1 Tax=Ornithobacterium rhinotracheale TaxID=28251 RepID=UPI001FF55957|nr:urease accessory protein UreE [Ornithobacterium rhinotracheale]MCK0205669.1 urease accessory protein UreE [Ornithobacterium rhinotracheale]
MIITQAIGKLENPSSVSKQVDYLDLEWFEATKKIQRKRTQAGEEVAIKFLKEGQRLYHHDILFEDENKLIVVNILPCEAIVISPKSLLEMGTVCYEIGNKHMPLFIQNDEVLMPYEHPMFRWLEASGYNPEKREERLLNLLKSNVEPHSHASSGTSLFTKILNLASTKE